jgi:hypothetical protein
MAEQLLLDKECFIYRQPIKIKRDNVRNTWIKYELDGVTLHEDAKNIRVFGSGKTQQKIEGLEKKLDELIAEVKVLREVIMTSKG